MYLPFVGLTQAEPPVGAGTPVTTEEVPPDEVLLEEVVLLDVFEELLAELELVEVPDEEMPEDDTMLEEGVLEVEFCDEDTSGSSVFNMTIFPPYFVSSPYSE